jgi:hypothetical protein
LTEPITYKTSWRMTARTRERLQAAVVAIVCLLVFFIVLRPWINNLGSRRDFQICQTSIQKMSKAIKLYSDDWEGAFPPADNWMTNIAGYMTATSGTGFDVMYYFHCPSDNSGSKASYSYNDLFSHFLPAVMPKKGDLQEEARQKSLGRFNRAPLIIEKHGSPVNAHLPLYNWEDVKRNMTLAHPVPELSGWMIRGDNMSETITMEKLQNLAGKKF